MNKRKVLTRLTDVSIRLKSRQKTVIHLKINALIKIYKLLFKSLRKALKKSSLGSKLNDLYSIRILTLYI